jgi:hypothetical protein
MKRVMPTLAVVAVWYIVIKWVAAALFLGWNSPRNDREAKAIGTGAVCIAAFWPILIMTGAVWLVSWPVTKLGAYARAHLGGGKQW